MGRITSGCRAQAGADPAGSPSTSPSPRVASPVSCHVEGSQGRALAGSGRLVRELERSFGMVRERARCRLVHYSIQRDHVHMIVEAASTRDLASGMKSIGARIARSINRIFGRCGPVLADRFHARVLRTPREVRNALAYVLLNARRHLFKAGRLVPRTGRIDPASSGRWFDGWRAALRQAHDPPVASPRTWLLRIGWRGVGLIDPSEVPGRRRT